MHCLLNRPIKAMIAPMIAAFLSGCVTSDTSTKQPSRATQVVVAAADVVNPRLPQGDEIAAIRYGRYTLVSTSPKADQIDLLSQIVDIRIPSNLSPTVKEAMDYVLRHSGYRLCPGDEEVQQLYAHSLPASHNHLGPISLRDALITLAGYAWQLETNERSRTVCFKAHTDTGIEPAPLMIRPATTLQSARGDQ